MSEAERAALRDEVRAFTMGDLSAFMERLPRDMLTVLRTECVAIFPPVSLPFSLRRLGMGVTSGVRRSCAV